MKSNTHVTRNSILGFLFCVGVSSACATTQSMTSGAGGPASQGSVRVSDGANGSSNIEVRVKHLAPPSKITADATVYVVWIKPANGEMQSVGILKMDGNLEGYLNTSTPHRSFVVMVSPESSSRASQPTNPPVFSSVVERKE